MDTTQQNRTMHGQRTISVALNVLFHMCVLVIIVVVCTGTALATELGVEDREIIDTELFDGTIFRLQHLDITANPDYLDFEYSRSVPNLDTFTSNSAGTQSMGQEIMQEACVSCNNAQNGVNVGVRNPAAVYCMEMGYDYKIENTENGESGICVMPNNEECDAWAFYRGECGREFSHCAKEGWFVAPQAEKDCFATNCTTCVLPDGSHKTVSELLNLSNKCTVGMNRIDENKRVSNTERTGTEEKKVDLPNYFDWRTKDGENWMTLVKDQGNCGGCWAFSAVGTTESQYNIFFSNPNYDLDLSEEYLVSDCSSAGSCCGGWHGDALNFIKDEGITDEACFPYVDVTGCTCIFGTCDFNCNYRTDDACSDTTCSDRCPDWSSRLKKIDATGSVSSNIETIKESLIEKGPLSVAMGIGSDFGGYFDNGIYRCTDDFWVNHGVVLVGYDETEDCWIAKNSWGSSWNGDGYFKVGYGECSIENYVYHAELTGTSYGTMSVSPTSWSQTIDCGHSDSQTVTVSATGGQVKGVTAGKLSGPAWLSVSPTNLGDLASGSSETFTMTAAPPSDTSGDFPYTVSVQNTGGNPSSTDVTGTIHVRCLEPTLVNVTPQAQTIPMGSRFTVNITVEPAVPLLGAQFDLSFDPSLIEANSVTEGNLLNQDGAPTIFLPGTIDNTAGTITSVAGAIVGGGAPVSGSGTFATISFTAKMVEGASPLDLSNVIVGNSSGAVPSTVSDGSVTVKVICPGDVNGDGVVNVLDMIKVGQCWNQHPNPEDSCYPADVNKDGVVNVLDMIDIGQDWGPCPPPPPLIEQP